MKNSIAIPYPLLEGVWKANRIIKALAVRGRELGLEKNELPEEIFPRKYSWNEYPASKPTPEDREWIYGNEIVFCLWAGSCGYYVRGELSSLVWDDGMAFWSLVSIRIDFRPSIENHGRIDKVVIRVEADDIKLISARSKAEDALDRALLPLLSAVRAEKK